MQKIYYLLYFRKLQEEINYYGYPPPGETLGERVVEVFKTSHKVLRQGEERFPDRKNPHSKALAGDVAELDLGRLAYLVRTGRGAVAMGSNANSWRDESLAIELAGLARARYIELQNEEVARLLGDSEIAATLLDGSSPHSITTHPNKDLAPVPAPAVGVIHSDTSVEYGHLLLQPADAEPGSQWTMNVHLLGHDGAQLVEIDVTGQEAQVPA